MEIIKTQLQINGELKDVEIKNGEITIIEPVKIITGWEKVEYSKTYYYDSSGLIYDTKESVCEKHTINYNNANYFSNMKLADNISRMQTLQRKIFRWQAENDIPINFKGSKWFFYFDPDRNEFLYNYTYSVYWFNWLNCYFSSQAKAEECVKVFKDELMWLFTKFQWRMDYDNNSISCKESSVNKND